METATFAGGCFWCMQHPFDEIAGVVQTTVGYTGGRAENPSYAEVSAGHTGHAEAIEVVFDPGRTSYEVLLNVFWRLIDPSDDGGQFVDRGNHYRTEIFYHSEQQRQLAEASRQALSESGRYGRPIVTGITPASEFFPAEEYHQKYYEKNVHHYQCYSSNCGRDQFLAKTWDKGTKHD